MVKAAGIAAMWRLGSRKVEAYRCQSAICIIHQEDAQLGSMLQGPRVSKGALGLVQVFQALAYLRHIANILETMSVPLDGLPVSPRLVHYEIEVAYEAIIVLTIRRVPQDIDY